MEKYIKLIFRITFAQLYPKFLKIKLLLSIFIFILNMIQFKVLFLLINSQIFLIHTMKYMLDIHK